jgi:hypothetical protein
MSIYHTRSASTERRPCTVCVRKGVDVLNALPPAKFPLFVAEGHSILFYSPWFQQSGTIDIQKEGRGERAEATPHFGLLSIICVHKNCAFTLSVRVAKSRQKKTLGRDQPKISWEKQPVSKRNPSGAQAAFFLHT